MVLLSYRSYDMKSVCTLRWSLGCKVVCGITGYGCLTTFSSYVYLDIAGSGQSRFGRREPVLLIQRLTFSCRSILWVFVCVTTIFILINNIINNNIIKQYFVFTTNKYYCIFQTFHTD